MYGHKEAQREKKKHLIFYLFEYIISTNNTITYRLYRILQHLNVYSDIGTKICIELFNPRRRRSGLGIQQNWTVYIGKQNSEERTVAFVSGAVGIMNLVFFTKS